MREYHRRGMRRTPSWSFILLCVLLVTLWVAGGASRADVPGQVIVRGISWALLAIAALLVAPPALVRGRFVLLILCASLALALAQLVPLPPRLWQALPGRTPFVEAAAASGQPQPWRSWSIVPSATVNAASSLVVPFATFFLVVGLKEEERWRLPGLILALITAAAFIGLLQFSGMRLENPLVNDSLGEVSGTFANRNHFALFVAFGCLLAPVWAVLEGRQPRWRGPVAIGLVLLFGLIILATGSRAGMAVGVLGIIVGLVLTRGAIKRALPQYSRWVLPAVGVAIALIVGLSVAAGRAISIDRALTVDAAQDMRSRGLPTVLAMVREYLPVGSGLGGFDPIFRLHEPLALLKFTYFNHAHNDFLEVVLDAGVPGMLLLLAALAWWGRASVQVWRRGGGTRRALPRTGSVMLLFVMLASGFDYPARTPMIMAMVVVAGLWLSSGLRQDAPALPTGDRQL